MIAWVLLRVCATLAGVPPSESYKLDRSMWMWLDDVARDGGVSAARLLYCSNAEVREMFSEVSPTCSMCSRGVSRGCGLFPVALLR